MRIEEFADLDKDNIERLAREFGDDKRPTIIARYSHQFHLSEENPNLNGELPRHIYKRTREILKIQYS